MANENQTSPGANGTPSKSNSRRVWIPVAIAILLVIGAVVVARHKRAPVQPVAQPTTIGDIGSSTSKSDKSASTSGATGTAKALSYSDALIKYQGKIVQFDPSCRATPTNQVFKVGTWIMLDNRSSGVQSVSLAGTHYNIKSYGYRLAKLTSAGTFQIDCGNLQNVATVKVER